MTAALASSEVTDLSWRVAPRSSVEGRLTEQPGSSRSIRLATAGVVAVGACLPLLTLGGVAVASRALVDPGDLPYAVLATVCYLPLQAWLVWTAARDARPRGQGWVLAVVAAVVLGTLPLVGARWVGALASLAALVVIVLPARWSLPLFAGLVVSSPLLASGYGHPELALLFALTPLQVAVSLAVPVWLVRTVRRLQIARLALAKEAVVRERLRIDGELRRTVGAALEAIAATGERASDLAATEPAAANAELRALVDGSRRTLADARRLLTRYQAVPLRAELETAASLLSATGVETHLELPTGDLGQVDEAVRAALRRDLVRLLGDGAAGGSMVTIARQHGRIRLVLGAGDPDRAATGVNG
jgi:two-component system, NarL family, sensor histidine kinase DesK